MENLNPVLQHLQLTGGIPVRLLIRAVEILVFRPAKQHRGNDDLPVEALVIVNCDGYRPAGITVIPGKGFPHRLHQVAFNLVCRQFPSDDTVLVNGDIIERAGIRGNCSADISISCGQPALRRQGKRRGIAGRGDTHRKQPLQEHIVHEQLIPLRHK
ncbi:hypothetical protein BvCmsJ25A_03378 [Escherichia coli]|nr:hypothetical protein BvCmsJ25A_03378 [Escherichia coli]GCI58606.1 hypothetical protein BvCmsA75A_04345 [Escherichia coli]GDR09617.1 hypothetical protein BvCmsNSP010_04431 [Escherichia coli]